MASHTEPPEVTPRSGKRLAIALDLFVLAAVLAVVLHPGGWVGQWFSEWATARDQQATIEEHWHDLVDGERLDRGTAAPGLVVFADFQCPFCRASAATLESLMAEYPDLGVVYRHFPLREIHPLAESAAVAAACAAEQARFREMHDVLFEAEDWQEEENWIEIAESAGVPDTGAFRACLSRTEIQELVERDARLGERIGVTGTPTFVFASGEFRSGVIPLEEMGRMVQDAVETVSRTAAASGANEEQGPGVVEAVRIVPARR